MNKVLLGLLLGSLLGAIDGGTAWFTPSVRAQLAGIIVGSTVKGLIAGMAAGFFARKVNSESCLGWVSAPSWRSSSRTCNTAITSKSFCRAASWE